MKPGEADAWPPKFWKFQLQTKDSAVEVAFTDPRRFGRVRLVDCPGDSIRKYSPLVENGPDPVVDSDTFTADFLKQKMRSRHVPIKALLLDQTVLSGIGNWVADEVLFQARLHPEQYCDEFNDEQVETLYKSIRDVCQLAVDKLGDSDQFPTNWLFHVRWGKGGKGAATHLPSGEKLAFLTVGGRTSCYVPELQKKTGRVVPGVKEEVADSDQDELKPKAKAKTKAPKPKTKEDDQDAQPRKRKKETDGDEEKPAKRGKVTSQNTKARTNGDTKDEKAPTVAGTEDGRRRSGRVRKSN